MTEYEFRILFGFQKSPNTEYRILFGIEKTQIPNTKYSSLLRKSKFQIGIVLFGLNIWIPNTKYQIVYTLLEKKKATKINKFISYKTFCLNFLWNYLDRYSDLYLNTQILFGVPKKLNTKYQILFVTEMIRIPNMNTSIWSNYSNSIPIPNYSSQPGKYI